VIATADEDVVRGVLRVARQHNATQIVAGKPARGGLMQWFRGGWSLRRLVEESGDIDIHVVRAEKGDVPTQPQMFRLPTFETWKQYATGLGVVVGVTLLNALLDTYTSIGYRALALDYLLVVVVLALFVGRGPVLLSATVSALVWDYFFLPPKYTFYITTVEDAMMFGTYFIVAVVMGQLIARFRTQEKAERRREERTTALYLLTRELADAVTLDQIIKVVVQHIGKLFNAEVAVLLADAGNHFPAEPCAGSTLKLSDKEASVAAWVFRHNQRAGQFTDNLPLSEALYVPLATPAGILGVIGVRLSQTSAPNLEQSNLLEAFVRQAALVIDRQRLHDAAQQSRLDAESERLGKTLLDSISHEMRTPIAAITSATGALTEANLTAQPALAATLVNEIREAVARLNRLVGNILDITRVESGHVKPKLDWCDVSDLINVTIKSVQKELAGHKLEIKISSEMPLVRMDFVLMEQALTNLLLNAAFHTPARTPVEVSAKVQHNELALTVSDHGPGVPAEAIPKIFDKFYRAPGAVTGGTGLGLSIVKGFVEAQGGRVHAENQPGGGAAFTIYLPVTEPPFFPGESA
jgi:two-component system sensor histidine kinase KdpD